MRIDGIPLKQINLTNASDILSKLNIGDILRAKIIDFASNEVLLKLFDGNTITAATMSSVDAKKGDIVEFLVKDKTEKQLFLETVKNNKQANSGDEMKKLITSLDLKPDSKNIEIANELKKNGLPLNKESFDKIINSIVKFSELTPQKAAFLVSHNLNINEKNISSLNSIINGNQKIGNDLEQLINLISLEDGNSDINNTATSQNFKNSVIQDSVETRSCTANTPILEDSSVLDIGLAKKITELLKQEINASSNASLKKEVDALLSEGKLESMIKSNAATPEGLKEGIRNILRQSISENTSTVSKNLSDSIDKLMAKLNEQIIDDLPELSQELHKKDGTIKDILSKKIEDIFINIKSSSLEDDIDARKLYKDILNTLDNIKDGLKQFEFLNKNDILTKIDNLESNVRFMNELNNYSTYIQIPLNMQGKNTNGELYILKKDPKRKKIDPDNMTMLISLDTQNIGKVDSFININKKNVSFNIRVEDEEIISLIKEHYKELYTRLSEKGFKLVDFKYRKMEEPIDILNFNENIRREFLPSKMSFDYRI